MTARRRHAPPAEAGQSLVEFAIAAPVTLLIIFGLIAGSLLFYNNVALTDGASAGARMATIESPLVQVGGTGFCETGVPETIARAVAAGAPDLAVNRAPLCASSATSTRLTQPPASGEVDITVTASPDVSAPTSVTVMLTFTERSLAPPFTGSVTMRASSTDPVEAP